MESETPVETTTSPTPTKNKTTFTLEDAHDEVDVLLDSGRVNPQEVAAIQYFLKGEIPSLREKVVKLKSLLGRSAKAQRDCKGELEQTQRKLREAQVQVSTLSQKVEKLASRPTHMDLLADFESNFDKALLQASGQDSAPPRVVVEKSSDEPIVDQMLMQELAETKQRMDSLESLLAHSKQHTISLEQQVVSLKRKQEHDAHKLKALQLELRMAQLEKEHATKSLQDKTASLQEMQLEIDLVTQASVSSSIKASQQESLLTTVSNDKKQISELQNRVQALQEWAMASAEAKSLAMQHVRLLEKQLQQEEDSTEFSNLRILTKSKGSLVIGAGDVGFKVMQLEELPRNDERVVLQWKFDSSPAELSVIFSLLKGVCDSPDTQSRADCLIKDRTVTGGAAGETEGALDVQNACTLLWSNASSWVRPRTIKYSLAIVAIKE